MNRLAIFVEGNSEVLFINKLITKIAGIRKVRIDNLVIRGGTKTPKTMVLTATQPNTGQQFYVIIIDCGGDNSVKTRIIEEHNGFTKIGYSKIIGVRDVRPNFVHADIPKLETNLTSYIDKKLIPVEFILCVMELESWFLAESTHFERIDPAITVEAIKNTLGFNPSSENMELRLHPADDLHKCYSIGGKSYKKGQVKRTVDALDYENIIKQLGYKFDYFNRLLINVNDFFATA